MQCQKRPHVICKYSKIILQIININKKKLFQNILILFVIVVI